MRSTPGISKAVLQGTTYDPAPGRIYAVKSSRKLHACYSIKVPQEAGEKQRYQRRLAAARLVTG
jgi:hypothetical protein